MIRFKIQIWFTQFSRFTARQPCLRILIVHSPSWSLSCRQSGGFMAGGQRPAEGLKLISTVPFMPYSLRPLPGSLSFSFPAARHYVSFFRTSLKAPTSSICLNGFCAEFRIWLEAFGWPQWLTFLCRCSLYSCDIFLPTFCQYFGFERLHIKTVVSCSPPHPPTPFPTPPQEVTFFSRSGESSVRSRLRCGCVRAQCVAFSWFFFFFSNIVSPHLY